MKLHLGCGSKHIDEFINIDIRYLPGVDEVDNIKFLRKYKNNSISLIYACHVLEHFDRYEYISVLNRWYDILENDGVLRISVPNFESICKYYLETKDIKSVIGLLYGGQDYDENFHYITFDFKSLEKDLMNIGFKSVSLYDTSKTEHSHIDDYSNSYLPHMDKNGLLMALNIEAVK
jgi:predicted SAM-dependent methyltransferase